MTNPKAGKRELPNTKYNLSKTLYLRYNRFLQEYINNGFNGAKAYLKTYRCKDEKTGKVEAHRLLTNPNVIRLLCDKLAQYDLDINEAYIIQKIHSLIEGETHESTRCRMLELLAKIKGMTKETSSNVAVFNNIDNDAVVRRRLEVGRDMDV